ncbi:MAG: response regulator transcription factor [Nocardioidaceae bacterium]
MAEEPASTTVAGDRPRRRGLAHRPRGCRPPASLLFQWPCAWCSPTTNFLVGRARRAARGGGGRGGRRPRGGQRRLLRAVAATAPDAVLTDVRMPPTWTDEGLRAAKQIRREHPDTGVVVLSQYAEPADIMELLSDGVAGLGYLLKERIAHVEGLVAVLRSVCRGGSALDPQVMEALVVRRTAQDRSPLAALSERELAVLRFLRRQQRADQEPQPEDQEHELVCNGWPSSRPRSI